MNDKLIGPWELPPNLNGENYLQFLEEDLPELLDDVLTRHQQEEIVFMHDGAPPHYTAAVRRHINNRYDNWIGRGAPIPWPAKSPDFNPLDFFYWGHSKETIYHGVAPETQEELRQRIHDHANNVPQHMLQSATNDVLRRVRLCIENDGGQFEHC